jgi:hypothetical protein
MPEIVPSALDGADAVSRLLVLLALAIVSHHGLPRRRSLLP